MLRSFISLLLFALSFSACGKLEHKNYRSDSLSSRTYSTPFPKIIGHRGLSSAAPENTIASFDAAIEAGADVVELDYYHSKDGVPVVVHDGTFDRTTNVRDVEGKEKVSVGSLNFSEIEKLDAGSWFGSKFKGEKIPSLEKSIQYITDHKATVFVERKGGDAKTFMKLYNDADHKNQIMVQSYDWDYLNDISKINDGIPLAALGREEVTGKLVDNLKGKGVKILSWEQEYLTKDAIDLVHKAGLEVFAYTVKSLDDARNLDDLGVDGIITDIPGTLKEKLRSN